MEKRVRRARPEDEEKKPDTLEVRFIRAARADPWADALPSTVIPFTMNGRPFSLDSFLWMVMDHYEISPVSFPAKEAVMQRYLELRQEAAPVRVRRKK